MKHARHAILVLLIVAVGAIVMTLYEWKQERKRLETEASQTAQRLVGLLSLYPFHDVDAGTRNLLAKTLVERSRSGVAYLLVRDANGSLHRANKTMLGLLGTERTALEANPYSEVLTRGDLRHILDEHRDGMSPTTTGQETQFEQTARNLHFHLACRPLLGAGCETDRLTALLRNLLNVSRMEIGTLQIERTLVQTDWLLDRCMPAVEATVKDKDLTFEKRLPDTFPTLWGDKELLKVMLVNIMGNAVKYTPENGSMRISLFQQDDSVFFEVTDTEYGIAADELPRIFDKFYRGSSAAMRDQLGGGPGLATALQIAKLRIVDYNVLLARDGQEDIDEYLGVA